LRLGGGPVALLLLLGLNGSDKARGGESRKDGQDGYVTQRVQQLHLQQNP
jgi:hypothetical protein